MKTENVPVHSLRIGARFGRGESRRPKRRKEKGEKASARKESGPNAQKENQFAAAGLIAAAMWARTPAGSAASSIVN